jgi:amino acid transporter
MAKERERTIGLTEAITIGIGGMVGGGIFAVLGLAVELGGGGTPLAFAIAGIVALLTAYSYNRLSLTCPSEGGTVSFLVEGFGSGLFSGTLNVLLWVSYIIMLSLYSYAFGSYGATFFSSDTQFLWKHVLISGIILGITFLNFFKANIIGRAENVFVGIKMGILVFFVAVGFLTIQYASFAPSTWEAPLTLISGGFIIFVAYEGFELIANTAQDVKQPERTLPIAYYTSVLFVIILYVLVAMVAVGNLPLPQIVAARDYALAEAARPFLGQAGFVLIVVAALLSTTSAINATLYGTTRFSYLISRFRELPRIPVRETARVRISGGLLITTAMTLLIANLLDLRDISTMGSGGFLLIFAAVNYTNYRLRDRTNANRFIALLGTVMCLGAVVALVREALITKPMNVLVLAVMLGVSFSIEFAYQKARSRAAVKGTEGSVECTPEPPENE